MSAKNSDLSSKIRKFGNKIFSRKNHDDRLHKKILINYSQSIALAPDNSKELILALTYRSILLSHLGKYEESIVDIDSALKFEECCEIEILLKLKLLRFKVLCLSALNRKEEAQKLFDQANKLLENLCDEDDKLKILKDLNKSINKEPVEEIKDCHLDRKDLPKKFPFISDSVTLCYNEKYGRHYIANRDLKPGEIVLIEKAYCAHPDFDDLYIVCSYCLKQIWNSIPCEYCAFAVYCSNDCKQKAWEKYHDLECSIYTDMFSNPSNDLSRLILSRLFLQGIKEIGISGLIENSNRKKNPADFGESKTGEFKNSDTYEFCSRLATIKSSAQPFFKETEKDFPKIFMKILKESKDFRDNKDFLNNYDKLIDVLVDINYMCVSNNSSVKVPNGDIFDTERKDYTQQIASALFPIACIFNHGCYPNLEATYIEGPLAVLYTIRSVKKDEQLYVTYGPGLSDDIKDREMILHKHYNFKCDCIACTEKWPVINEKNAKKYLDETPDEYKLNFMNMLLQKQLKLKGISTLKDICELIETILLCYPPYQAAIIIKDNRYRCTLWKLMRLSLGPVFQVPNECKI